MTIGSTMPMAVNKRNAASRPFHVFDCYIRNHSPHTNKKATGHNITQAAKQRWKHPSHDESPASLLSHLQHSVAAPPATAPCAYRVMIAK
jgi:hypothetical protein